MKKKLITICFLTISLLFSNLTQSFALSKESSKGDLPSISEEQFNKFKANGIYSEDVTYQDLMDALAKQVPMPKESDVELEWEMPNYENSLEVPQWERRMPYSFMASVSAYRNYRPKAGDIVITQDVETAGWGLVGHAGIFISDNEILHIAGSDTSYVTTLTWSQWKRKFDRNSVYRVPNSNMANKAVSWVKSHYKDKKPGYKITLDIYKTSPTYCSKIVWQAYYFGTGSAPVMKPVASKAVIAPGALPNSFMYEYKPKLLYVASRD